MKNVICYCRISSDDQSHHSIPYQEEAIKRYCDHKGYNVVATYFEDYSAKTFNRPEWKNIIEFLKNNKSLVQKIICLRYDRFSRNFTHSSNEIVRLKGLGCEIEMVESNIEMNSPESMLTRNIMLTLPEIENAKISIRSTEGSHKARKSGCFTGHAPKGYKNVRLDMLSTLDFSEDANLIRSAFERMASGTYSADEIRRWLNSNGMTISKNTFLGIIRNITYTGKIWVKPFLEEPEQTVQGLHPALVSDEVFAAANDVLDGRRRKMKFKDDKSDLYPLKGHLVCPIHGRTLSAYASRSRNGQLYHYYVCTKNRCPRYPIDHAHSEIERLLGQVQFSARVLKSYRSILERIFEFEDSNRTKAIQHKKDELERLKTRKIYIQDEYIDGKITSQEYQELKMSLSSKIYETEKNLLDMREEHSPYKDYLDRHVPALEDLTSLYQKVGGKTKKQILSCIFSEKIHFENGKAATPKLTPPIDVLMNLRGVLEGPKTKQEVYKDLLCTLAPEAGLEPATL